jgi:hypothetical protein
VCRGNGMLHKSVHWLVQATSRISWSIHGNGGQHGLMTLTFGQGGSRGNGEGMGAPPHPPVMRASWRGVTTRA